VAWCYDALAAAYSWGRIQRSRRLHLGLLEPGDEVLYAGVGRGREAIEAARVGARVTAVDLSAAMLKRLAREAQRASVDLELIQGDVTRVLGSRCFDWVVGHYFLNLYGAKDSRALLASLAGRLRPAGRLCIADFAPPRSDSASSFLMHAYYAPLNGMAAAVGLCARHPIPDYRPWLAEIGLRITEVGYFPLPVLRSLGYWTLIATRPARGEC
jgi:demethylmenaquinone methyltransferase/2-methoxy-6-polyprenyl-1,4-benzoquinol methylase